MNYNSFSSEPDIKVNPHNEEKPFILQNTINYLYDDDTSETAYNIHIDAGYTWNGANIPKYFWRIIGSQYDPQFLPASMIHDWLCEHKDYIKKHGVKISSDIFKEILILYKVPKAKAWLMASAVRGFQYTQRGWN